MVITKRIVIISLGKIGLLFRGAVSLISLRIMCVGLVILFRPFIHAFACMRLWIRFGSIILFIGLLLYRLIAIICFVSWIANCPLNDTFRTIVLGSFSYLIHTFERLMIDTRSCDCQKFHKPNFCIKLCSYF